jgi:hypothetical protein
VPSQTPKRTEAKELRVIDDWPEELPITEAELDLFEAHLLDMITAMAQHG